jgi:malate dehydrogenase
VSLIAIIGAGPIGSTVAHRLAQRTRVNTIRMIDAAGAVAAGKALDIRQAGPIEHFDAIVESDDDVRAAASADVIVVADEVTDGEWQGDKGLAMLRQLVNAGMTAPMVFAGASQSWLMERAYRELKVPANRLIGSAASAVASAVQAIAGLELGMAAFDVPVVGRWPGFVVGWSSAASQGILLTDRVPAHRLAAISAAVPKLWPPKPYAIGAATAPIVEALVSGSRGYHHAATVIDGQYGARGVTAMLPLQLGRGRVLNYSLPSLSPQERTEFMNAVAAP